MSYKEKEVRRVFENVLKYPKAVEMIYDAMNKEGLQNDYGDQYMSVKASAKIIYPILLAFQGILDDEFNDLLIDEPLGCVGGSVLMIDENESNDHCIRLKHIKINKDKLYLCIVNT